MHQTMEHVKNSENRLSALVISFPNVGSRNLAQVISPSTKSLYLLSHVWGPCDLS